VRIGRNGTVGEHTYFKGEMDELSIWSEALNNTQVSQRALMNDLTPVSADLLAHFPMDTGSGSIFYDSIYGDITGNLVGGVRWLEVCNVIT
jgi:hypothetical protein